MNLKNIVKREEVLQLIARDASFNQCLLVGVDYNKWQLESRVTRRRTVNLFILLVSLHLR